MNFSTKLLPTQGDSNRHDRNKGLTSSVDMAFHQFLAGCRTVLNKSNSIRHSSRGPSMENCSLNPIGVNQGCMTVRRFEVAPRDIVVKLSATFRTYQRQFKRAFPSMVTLQGLSSDSEELGVGVV